MQTNFQKVLEFNKAFGVPTYSTIQHNIFDENPKLVEYRLSLIEEEFNELKEAIKDKNIIEVIDGLSDLYYVLVGMAASFGIDIDKSFNVVHMSNLSKLCETEDDAKETVKRYKTEIPQRYDSPTYRLADDGKNYVVYNASTMKILKSWKYTPAIFTSLL